MKRRSLLKGALVAGVVAGLGAPSAMADESAVVRAFYSDLLSRASEPGLAERAKSILADDWMTYGNNDQGGPLPKFLGAVEGFGQVIPDLKWEIQELLVVDNRYIVRGRATGTPAKPFFGVEPSGKSFDIMSIDIHTVEGGRITRSYHVEDWAGALQQLTAR